jgi:hypothetical protein
MSRKVINLMLEECIPDTKVEVDECEKWIRLFDLYRQGLKSDGPINLEKEIPPFYRREEFAGHILLVLRLAVYNSDFCALLEIPIPRHVQEKIFSKLDGVLNRKIFGPDLLRFLCTRLAQFSFPLCPIYEAIWREVRENPYCVAIIIVNMLNADKSFHLIQPGPPIPVKEIQGTGKSAYIIVANTENLRPEMCQTLTEASTWAEAQIEGITIHVTKDVNRRVNVKVEVGVHTVDHIFVWTLTSASFTEGRSADCYEDEYIYYAWKMPLTAYIQTSQIFRGTKPRGLAPSLFSGAAINIL